MKTKIFNIFGGLNNFCEFNITDCKALAGIKCGHSWRNVFGNITFGI